MDATTRTPPDVTARSARPGWPEILVALGVFALVGYGAPPLLRALGIDHYVYALTLAAWSGVAGIIAFTVAARLRARSLPTFGLVRPTWRWVGIAVGAGVVAWVLTRIAAVIWTAVVGTPADVQAVYGEAANAGALSLVLSTLFLAVLTPIGEELVFRGVVTTALLRYGPVVAVVGSAAVFALFHGLSAVLVTAFIVGLVNGELRRRSGSVWPGVIVHVVNNLIANLALFLLT